MASALVAADSMEDVDDGATSSAPRKDPELEAIENIRGWAEALDPLPPWNPDQRNGKRGNKANPKNIANREEIRMKVLEARFEQGRQEYENHVLQEEKNGPQTAEKKWMQTILRSGTSSDRTAAMTVAIQEAPFESLRTLRAVVAMAHKKKARREISSAAATLKDLFVYNLLPDRKLNFFRDQDFQNPAATPRHFMYWYFENELKKSYAEFIQALEIGTKDTITHHKNQMLHFAYELLVNKPEQEQVLLSLLINKLGDPEKKVSSKMVYLLGQLVQKHPNMQPIVIAEVDLFLHRSNLSSRAQYCAVIFLNQLVLDGRHKEVAMKLIDIYFSMFRTCVEGGEVQSKMLSALLTGVSRALPFARCDTSKFQEHIDTLFKIVNSATLNKAIQALVLLLQLFTYSGPPAHILAATKLTIEEQQIIAAQKVETERNAARFYRALYHIILSPDLFMSAKQALFLNVLYKSMKADRNFSRVVAFVKRLLQVCLYQKPPFISGVLFMLAQLATGKSKLRNWLKHYANHEEENTELVGGKPEDKNAVKQEGNGEAPKEQQKMKLEDEKEESEESEEEGEDAEEGEEPEEEKENGGPQQPRKKHLSYRKRKRREEREREAGRGKDRTVAWANFYDPLKREPEFANADKTCGWELRLLAQHYHPAVSRFALALMSKGKKLEEELKYEGDPLQDFTLGAFLERFSFRNPKQKVGEGSGSLMQPRATPHWVSAVPVNNPLFLQQAERKVRAEEVFFFQYFKGKEAEKTKEEKAKAKDKARNNEEDDAFDDLEKELEGGESQDRQFQETLNRRLAASKEKPDKEAGTYSYDDLDLDDLEEGGDAAEGRYDDEEDDDFYEQLLMKELENEAEAGAFDDELDGVVGESHPDFASAEEFAHLLEESGRDYDAPDKQVAWEFSKGGKGGAAGTAGKKGNNNNKRARAEEAQEDDEDDEFDPLDVMGFDEVDLPEDTGKGKGKGEKRKRPGPQGPGTKKPRTDSSGGKSRGGGRGGRGGRGGGGRGRGRGGRGRR